MFESRSGRLLALHQLMSAYSRTVPPGRPRWGSEWKGRLAANGGPYDLDQYAVYTTLDFTAQRSADRTVLKRIAERSTSCSCLP